MRNNFDLPASVQRLFSLLGYGIAVAFLAWDAAILVGPASELFYPEMMATWLLAYGAQQLFLGPESPDWFFSEMPVGLAWLAAFVLGIAAGATVATRWRRVLPGRLVRLLVSLIVVPAGSVLAGRLAAWDRPRHACFALTQSDIVYVLLPLTTLAFSVSFVLSGFVFTRLWARGARGIAPPVEVWSGH